MRSTKPAGPVGRTGPRVKILRLRRRWAHCFALASLAALLAAGAAQAQALAQPEAQARPQTQTPPPLRVTAGAGVVELQARQQRKEGSTYIAEGEVEIHYGQYRLTADRVQYNTDTSAVVAEGHVEFDYQTQQIFGDRAEYDLKTGHGEFHNVHGFLHIMREPNASLYVTQNPLYFTADDLERVDEHTYRITKTMMTVCDPNKPTWTFYAGQATLHVDQTVALLNANFRLFRIPLLWVPYASLPAKRTQRQSGFLLPEFGKSTIKGDILGDAFYWAPTYWADATIGAQILTARGASETGFLQMRPAGNVTIDASYFGVVDQGLPGINGVRFPEGGHTFGIKFDAELKHGWRAVANISELSSLTFQLVFSPTFNEAVNSEVTTTAFLTNNFHGFSFDLGADEYKDFLTAGTQITPQTSLQLRSWPEVRFDSVDQAPWQNLPIYFGFDTYQDAVSRSDPLLTTPLFVSRSNFAPETTIPLHWKNWLNVTSTFTFLATRYGVQQNEGAVLNQPIWRTVGEMNVDFVLPTLERIWQRPHSKWKHTIEPEVIYNYVTGMNDFTHFIRIDEDDTITDTNQVEYSLTQRLYRRLGDASASAQELASWSLYAVDYFDPTFGGALISGQPNIFAALDAVTPFAFADEPVHYSPLVSDFRIFPGGTYEFGVRTDYDPERQRFTSLQTLVKFHPKKDWEFTAAYYSIEEDPANLLLEPESNQIRMMASYGALNRKGWGVSGGVSYDFREGVAQNEMFNINYNGSCCGVAFGFQRLSLGQIVVDNQFRASFVIANIGQFGNLHKLESVF